MIVESVNDVIKLSGDLTSNHWETIRTAAGLVLKRHPRGVVVDASGITSCTEMGAHTFYDMMRHIERQKARIIVASLPDVVREQLKHVPEVRSRLAIANSVADAQHSLDLLETISGKPEPKRHSTGVLILALNGGPADSYAISLAGAVAEMRQLRVVVLFAIVVPQALPATTPLPEKEVVAENSLHKAKEALRLKNISAELSIERTRSIASAVEKIAGGIEERTVVVSLPEADVRTREPMRTVEELVEKLTSELVLVREPRK